MDTLTRLLDSNFDSLSPGPWNIDLGPFHRLFDPARHARARSRDGTSLLRYVVRVALDWRTDLYSDSLRDTTPLVNIGRRLLQHGADPNDINDAGDSLLTEIFSNRSPREICPDIVRLLLQFGADANHVNCCRDTCLMLLLSHMSRFGRHLSEEEELYLHLGRCLLETGADPNQPDSGGWMPVALPGLTHAMRELLRAYGARTRDEHDADWLKKHVLLRQRWSMMPAELQKRVLAYAFPGERFYDALGCFDRVRSEMSRCLRVQPFDARVFHHLFNPSYWARTRGPHSFLRQVVQTASQWRRHSRDTGPLVRICRQLLEHGADPNDIVYGDESLLTEMCGAGIFWHICPDIVGLLIQFGADVNHRDARGDTSLMLLLHEMSDRLDDRDPCEAHEETFLRLVRPLLDAGADPAPAEQLPQLLDSVRDLLRAYER